VLESAWNALRIAEKSSMIDERLRSEVEGKEKSVVEFVGIFSIELSGGLASCMIGRTNIKITQILTIGEKRVKT